MQAGVILAGEHKDTQFESSHVSLCTHMQASRRMQTDNQENRLKTTAKQQNYVYNN
jgi:hypothetical protein